MNTAAPKAPAIQTRNLRKCYGGQVAVAGLDLEIAEGEFFGLLGRNGSGKTTTLHMLSTLIRPSNGTAIVAGRDILARPVAVRARIGLVFQESALDRSLSVEENLQFAGAMYDLPPDLVRQRMDELLKLFDLGPKRRVLVAALSGGMRRALDIARGVLHRPRVLFLDEPTIGLDVINRRAIWRFLARLRQEQGVTVVLTTHYLEEAVDCDRVVFMSHGEIIGSGKPAELTQSLATSILEITADEPEPIIAHLQPLLGDFIQDGNHLQFRVRDGMTALADWQRQLPAPVRALALRQPDLNDVYVWMNRSAGRPSA
ncbi:MAG TPA: ABC transporter ATP-binding protein [Gammaproteobacteria bacterium]|nr:ABC transporter ATP-binding protein [Gammaproteobacteria bacterium]